jgi:hypothetical protein
MLCCGAMPPPLFQLNSYASRRQMRGAAAAFYRLTLSTDAMSFLHCRCHFTVFHDD